jgi:B-cell receptor-associated protein 31
MAVFGLLIVPMPFTWRRKIFIFLSENPVVAKVQYGLKVWRLKAQTVEECAE